MRLLAQKENEIMARILTWRPMPKPAVRFLILSHNEEQQTMEVQDALTKTVYTIQAAGKVEFQTLLNASQERWVQISKSIEG